MNYSFVLHSLVGGGNLVDSSVVGKRRSPAKERSDIHFLLTLDLLSRIDTIQIPMVSLIRVTPLDTPDEIV